MAELLFPLQGRRVFVAGETGLVGRTLCDELQKSECEVISAPRNVLDLRDAQATYNFLSETKPDAIFLVAAKVGGIGANAAYPADFIHDNLAIAQSVINGAHRADVSRLLFLGSSCIYPKLSPQPITEEALLSGALEPTNEAYAIAKIAGLKMIEAYRKQYKRQYIAAMPTNLYGPYDRFDSEAGHVIPAMIEKFMKARDEGAAEVVLWGTGAPLREFLYASDLARALFLMMEQYDGDVAPNIGSGEEVSIQTLAVMIAGVTGFDGKIAFDAAQPDGTPRKFLNSDRIRALGWKPKVNLEDGLRETVAWYEGVRGAEVNLPAGRIYASSGT